ncbi:XdhC family protein [Nocardia brasiliensis]|uniref:XdhC family protein n=1 Tax=Nocardia brasiliensis TaxID=37326 RepID=UPI003D908679
MTGPAANGNSTVLQWIQDRLACDDGVVAATVADTFDRSPYPAGTIMAFARDGGLTGSVSSGCVEADLYTRAQQIFLEHPRLGESPPRILTFDAAVESGDPFAAPHPCGGALTIVLHELTAGRFPELPILLKSIHGGRPITTALNLRTGRILLDPEPGDIGLGHDVLRTRYEPPPRLLIFGISDIAVELATLASRLDHRITVCDPRSAFLRPTRFPETVELVADWPDRYLRRQREIDAITATTAVVDLTHEDRFSLPLLLEALDSPRWPPDGRPAFVGALASRARSAIRRRALRDLGLSASDEAALRSPIGLNPSGRTAPLIALSILAQLHALGEPTA